MSGVGCGAILLVGGSGGCSVGGSGTRDGGGGRLGIGARGGGGGNFQAAGVCRRPCSQLELELEPAKAKCPSPLRFVEPP